MIDFDAILEKHKEVQRRQIALKNLREIATDTSVHLTDMPSGGGDGKRQERDVVNIVDAEQAYLRASAELKAMKKELSVYLPCLKKWQHKDAIEKRYMDGLSLNMIMQTMGYEWAQVNRFIAEGKEIILQAEAAQNDIA